MGTFGIRLPVLFRTKNGLLVLTILKDSKLGNRSAIPLTSKAPPKVFPIFRIFTEVGILDKILEFNVLSFGLLLWFNGLFDKSNWVKLGAKTVKFGKSFKLLFANKSSVKFGNLFSGTLKIPAEGIAIFLI